MAEGPGWATPGGPAPGERDTGGPRWGTPQPPGWSDGPGQPAPPPGPVGPPPQSAGPQPPGIPPGAPGGPPGPWRWGAAAPRPGIIPLRPLALGEILDGTFATVRANPGATIGVTVASAAVVETISTLIAIGAQDASRTTQVLATIASFALELVLSLFLSGVLSVVVSEATLGSRIGPTEAVRRIAPRLPGLAALTLAVLAAVVLGMIALLIGAIVVAVYLSLATPAYILEGGGVRHALRRSVAIVRGSWWRAFGILLLAMLVSLMLSAVFALVTGIVLVSAPGVFGEFYDGDLTIAGHIVEGIGNLVATTVSTPIFAGAAVLLYVDLRIRREGLDVTLAEAARQRAAGAGPRG
ncbi:hypothetical protein MXD59_24100 [Frankia sp. Ag45/Mut15]|uniref:Integral membrane protein n=1 Tax=Frankia umida TaxID=573489 RepID=A0ABT0K4T5_9ACTN|nr:hypothetical protein [Frankia umida]MCK9878807.1 hypothetical protein [Frankia umida]